MKLTVIKTRGGDVVKFDRTRIEIVIEKAGEAAGILDHSYVENITDNVIKELINYLIQLEEEGFVTVEMIQDQVEKELMEAGHFDIAKKFILYRNERLKQRQKQKDIIEKKLEQHTLKITKTSGKKEIFDMEKVRKTYKLVSY